MTATPDSVALARTAASAAFEKVATSVVAIDVSERLVLTDVFVVASGETGRQVRAIVDAVDEALHKVGVRRLRREGYEGEAHWVLVDYGDLIVHVQQDEDREYYALEKLWADCPSIDVADLEGQR
ncbi:ribosome silencing factor [Flaviflexus salsibiostraticola]|uniref:Ribosomal silencing factor RsfS n=1 Tax=Flaviflexus salsibiostraticola TaxID=1282737 RepID=A0A3S8Z7X6_9ACTO|nr:ribosome silencing factor [Flaviflexus salsibiostraticola]AZN29554.1 ribosome silencing factor [Flaviflexus salsibiostraticola]